MTTVSFLVQLYLALMLVVELCELGLIGLQALSSYQEARLFESLGLDLAE